MRIKTIWGRFSQFTAKEIVIMEGLAQNYHYNAMAGVIESFENSQSHLSLCFSYCISFKMQRISIESVSCVVNKECLEQGHVEVGSFFF